MRIIIDIEDGGATIFNSDEVKNTEIRATAIFDDRSPLWSNDSDFNMYVLRNQERYANDMLKARGHVFLNEVYDMLGLPRTSMGAISGWVFDDIHTIEFETFPTNDNGYLIVFHNTEVILDKI